MAKLSALTNILKNIPKATAQVAAERVKSLAKSVTRAPARLARVGVSLLSSGIAREFPEVAALGGIGTGIISDIARKASMKRVKPNTQSMPNNTPVMRQQPVVPPHVQPTQMIPDRNDTGKEVSKLLTPLKQILASIHHTITQNDRLYSEVRSLTDITRAGLDITKKSLNETRKTNKIMVDKENLQRFRAQEVAGLPKDTESIGVSKMSRVGKMKEEKSPLTALGDLAPMVKTVGKGALGYLGIKKLAGLGKTLASKAPGVAPTASAGASGVGKLLRSPVTKLITSSNILGLGINALLTAFTAVAIPAFIKTIKDFKFTEAFDDITDQFKRFGLVGGVARIAQQFAALLEIFGNNLQDYFMNFVKTTWDAIKNFDFLGATKDLFTTVGNALFGPEGTDKIAEAFTGFVQSLTDKYYALKKSVINTILSVVPNDTGIGWIDDKLHSIKSSLMDSLKTASWDADINKGVVPNMTKSGLTERAMSFEPQPTQETLKTASMVVNNAAISENKNILDQQRTQLPINTNVNAVSAPTTNTQTVFNTVNPSVRQKDSFYSP